VDLGLAGRSAILLASSRGLGRACAESLAREGVNLVVNGRDRAVVERTAAEIRAMHGVAVIAVAGDTSDPATHDALLEVTPTPDIVLLNGGGPPPTSFDALTPASWRAAVEHGLIGPLTFLQRVLPGMCERGFGRVVVVSSAMVKTPNPMMSLSQGTRLGLTGVLKGVSKSVARHGVTINQLLPERFDTERQNQMAQVAMEARGISYDEARAEQVRSIRARRLGRPDEFGDTCAFLCSQQAGFINGTSLLLDGGSYEGVM
jgi:3-oxoacyl-[acyl-carrier protein] reductase